jgi:hypothetical protein
MVYIFWPGYWTMLAVIAVVGVAVGGSLPLWGLLVAASFRSQDFGKATGTMGPGMQLVSIAFVRLSGEAFDRTGDYRIAMWCFAAAALVAVGLVAATRLGGTAPVKRPA